MTNEEAMYIISECFLNAAASMADSDVKGGLFPPGTRQMLTDQYLREICDAVIDRVLDGR